MNARADLRLDPPVYIKDLPDDDPMKVYVRRSEQLLRQWQKDYKAKQAAKQAKEQQVNLFD